MTNNKSYRVKNTNDDEILNQSIDSKLAIDDLDQKLLRLLLKGYEHKKIAMEAKAPLSTIQRRIRKIFDNQYVQRKNELNYKKLGLRKAFLQISLKGNFSNVVAQKISRMEGITFVSQVTGSFDILCFCLFRYTDDLFNIIESIKTIERVDTLLWSEEVRNLPIEEIIGSDPQASI